MTLSQASGLTSTIKARLGDRIFSRATLIAGVTILVALAAVAIFLIAQSIPAITATPEEISPNGLDLWQYILPLVFGTVWAAAIALAIAVPISIGIALFISHYAPRRLAQSLGYVVDLLAAVPSVVYGLWGITVLAPLVQPFYSWLVDNVGWFPLFTGPVSGTGRTVLTVAVVLAVVTTSTA